ncbi:MAG TPA: hypothetical protein VFT82_04260 [Candidatus Paceibacterota bacterium]|nr:hypothetical protein [Candidatus Paceibacterota bacterium]
MRIVTTSYEVAGPNGTFSITTFRVKGLRLRKKVPVLAKAKAEARAKRK